MTLLPDVSLSSSSGKCAQLCGGGRNLRSCSPIITSQVLAYYQQYRRDADAWLRCFVTYLLVLETLNTGFDMQMTYQPLVLQHGQVLDYFPTVFVSELLCVFGAHCVVSRPQPDSPPQVLVSTPTQFFFAWRIWSLTRVRTTPVH
ncbi:hypothetical protein K438DRAFT_2101834 [Mycena galopus ATCC 62051]|nr:hypothetical protein K438DRAFT_2101834 [Mycena galopus ATCC 62051]